MTSTDKNCAVLHCASGSSSDVEFFDFPEPHDPRYAVWIERTLQGSQWTPSSTSTICSQHFREAHVLTTEAADDSGRTEKRLKYDALPCVFEPESERPQAPHVPRPDSPEITYQAPKQLRSRAVTAADDASTVAIPAIDATSLPPIPVDDDPNVCCVPGCPSRRRQGVVLRSVSAVRFHAFPTDKRLHWEWTKRVRCSVSWQPGPSAVVCSAHFVATDYELSLISGMLFLKPTAIPRQLACVGVFMMRRTESPGPSDRMCAICGCWRMRNQMYYKAAARLAFVPFPTDPEEREKWNALSKEISRDADLFACENHFLLNEIVSRFQESGEEKFTVRSGVMPRVEPTLWLDPPASPSEEEIPRDSTVKDVRSTTNNAEISVQMPETGCHTQTAPKLVVLFRDGTLTPTVQLCNIPGMLPLAIARNVESTMTATEVCCVPGCSVTSSNAGVKGVYMLRFISRANSHYTTWINRIRCATTWVEEYPLAICSKHFLPEDFDPGTQTLLPNALPSQLSCISAFHFSGLREWETDVTEMLVCVVCSAKRKPCLTKSSEWLKLFRFPADPVSSTTWCKFVSAERAGQIVDTSSLICENHFLSTDFDVGSGALKPSAVPFYTFRLQPEFKPVAYIRIPSLTAKTPSNINGLQPMDSSSSCYQCCVSGCKNDEISRQEKVVRFFKFVAKDDPRYGTWLERVRPHDAWIPDMYTRICSAHFLPTQITFSRQENGKMVADLISSALPSLLNGETKWEPTDMIHVIVDHPIREPRSADLKRFSYKCCVAECGTLRGQQLVNFFRFPARKDPRYEIWLERVRPNDGWIPDTETRICSAHFLSSQSERRKSGSYEWTVLDRKALPSLLNGNCMWEPNQLLEGEFTRPGYCCVSGCRNRKGLKGSKKVSLFKFIKPEDPRYETWLQRVRPETDWIPNEDTKICSEHFLPSQVKSQKRKRKTGMLSRTALPSQSDGKTIWEPADFPSVTVEEMEVNEVLNGELTRREDCCVSGCETRRGFNGSKKVSLFKFIKPKDSRYEIWLERVKPETGWIPNSDTQICSEHFLPSQINSKKEIGKPGTLSRTALPSQSGGKTMWEPADFGSVNEEQTESDGTRRFSYACCVPGCGNVPTATQSKDVSFFKFIAPEGPRYHTWLRRLQYNSAWIPNTWTKVCSEHFLAADFVRRRRGVSAQLSLSSLAVPSQLSCMTTLCDFTESDVISGKTGCVVCGLKPLFVNRERKPSERLQFFPCPVGEMKTKWIDFVGSQAAKIDSGRLAETASWFVCENHFVKQSFEQQTEKATEARCLLADAVPSVPFTMELDYVDPMLKFIGKGNESVLSDGTVAKKKKRKKKVDDSSVFDPSSSKCTCVVPGCPMTSRTAYGSSSERVSFHVFPSRSSTRFTGWMDRIRCAVSWSPKSHSHVCSLHFLPGDFVQETSTGKQPKMRQIKKTAVPSQLQCMEKFRSPRGMNSAHDGEIRACCVCGCWRSVQKESYCKRSERLAFFPFPVDDDQREVWVEVCRKYQPEFALSDESVVCENHFRQDELICIYTDKQATKLESNAVPSGRNFAWTDSGCDDAISENYLSDASDVDMEETMDDGMAGYTETDYEDVVDTQLENVSSMDENPLFPSSAIKWQISPDNGLPEDDAGDTFMNAVHLMADLPSARPSSTDDVPTEPSQPLLATNGALMYCAKCQVFLQTPCWMHSNVIPDEPVISLAVGSLPNILYMDVCDDSPNEKTVLAKETVPRHTVFGPLVAPLMAEEHADAQYFAVSEAGTGSRRKHYNLESDYACNWMKYVRWADSMEASNLLVFARGLEIVFVTSRTISSHEELRVWYSAQYTQVIADVKSFIPDLHPDGEATAVKADALEFMDIVDDGASLFDLESNERDTSKASLQNLPIGILPVSDVPSLPETIHGDLDISMNQVHNRQKRSRALRDDTSCYLNRNICTECSTRFRLSDLLELHKYSHSQLETMTMERPERHCPECRKEFPAFDQLLQHVNDHGTKLVPCPVCDDLCSTTTLGIHVKRYHPESYETGKRIRRVLDCHECGVRFTNAFLYRVHKFKHGIVDNVENVKFPEKCPECRKVFHEMDSLVEHVQEHGKTIGKCPVCQDWFASLDIHIRRNHPAYHSQRGSQRGRGDKGGLSRTAESFCTTCAECGTRFPSDDLCQLHNIGHGKSEEIVSTLELPTKCPQCDELFADLEELVDHVDLHGKASMKCPVCDLWVGFLSGHMRRKHPDYDYFYLPKSQLMQSRDDISARRNLSHRESDVQQPDEKLNSMFHRLTCYECRLRFPTEMLHQFHSSRHATRDCVEWPKKCPECNVPFDEIERPLEHVDKHAKRVRKCHLCHQWRLNLTTHMRHSHPEYHGRRERKRNWDSESTAHSVACPDCGLRFTTHFLCGIHETKHGREEYVLSMTFPKKCPECDQLFEERNALVEHVDTHGKSSKKCPVCNMWFGYLSDHLRHSHPDYSKILTCDDCGLRFPTDALYHLHKYKHENKNGVEFPQNCPECSETFEEFDGLIDHIDQHGKCLEKCPVCHGWYSALKDHMRVYHPAPELDSVTDRRRSLRKRPKSFQDFHRLRKPPNTLRSTCQICDVCFPAEALCKLHTYKHGRNEYAESLQFPQECPECWDVFEELSELVDHVEKHGERAENGTIQDRSLTESETEIGDDDPVSRENPFENVLTDRDERSNKGHACPECGKKFRLRVGLQAHSKTCRRRIKCVICSEIFESKSDFDQHVASHETDGGFLCGICLEKFPFYRILVAHVEKHASENSVAFSGNNSDSPFKCIVCQDGFASSDELNKHVKSHEEWDGFTCAVCHEKFPFYRLLSRHMSDEHHPADALAEYSCTICLSAFSRLSDLEMHLFAHDAELQFKCDRPQCGKRFASMKSLQGHVYGFHEKQNRKASGHKLFQAKRKKVW